MLKRKRNTDLKAAGSAGEEIGMGFVERSCQLGADDCPAALDYFL